MKKAAVICSEGMGDGLMMMVASHRLFNEGYDVTTFHKNLTGIESWFPDHKLASYPPIEELEHFDLILLQNANIPYVQELVKLYYEHPSIKLSIFYASHEKHKHPPLRKVDHLFNPSKPMTNNIAKGVARLVKSRHLSKNNGIVAPEGLQHRRFKKRVVIHPTSQDPLRTWTQDKFISIAYVLQERGYDVHLALSPEERKEWANPIGHSLSMPYFASLSELAAFLYESGYLIGNESGTGHLASNLQIPTLIIAGNRKRIQLWRPGWRRGRIITPPCWIPNFKGIRTREKKWQAFISPQRVLKAFEKMK